VISRISEITQKLHNASLMIDDIEDNSKVPLSIYTCIVIFIKNDKTILTTIIRIVIIIFCIIVMFMFIIICYVISKQAWCASCASLT
jgi:hypothetical protein